MANSMIGSFRFIPFLLCVGALAAPAMAVPCPSTPGNLPRGKAQWTEKGDARWLLTTDEKKSYPCAPPSKSKKMSSDGIYTDYEYTDFVCGPLKITASKCVMDEGKSYYPSYGLGKDFYTALCEAGGRWSYSLVDKNGDKFSLTGFPDFSESKPDVLDKTCSNTHAMQHRSVWLFMSGSKYIYINKIQNYIATAVKQPSL